MFYDKSILFYSFANLIGFGIQYNLITNKSNYVNNNKIAMHNGGFHIKNKLICSITMFYLQIVSSR